MKHAPAITMGPQASAGQGPAPLTFGFDRIVVATDFSPRSKKAVDYAVQLAQRLGARLTLVHVHPEPVDYALGQIPIWYWEEVRATMEAKLAEQLAQARRSYPAVDAQLRTAHDFREELLTVAQDLRAGLLVLSTHGSIGWKHLLFGSDAEKILERAPCPILVVR